MQPPYFGGRLSRADIVIDHHAGYQTGISPFEDIRIGYGCCNALKVTPSGLDQFSSVVSATQRPGITRPKPR